MNYRKIYDNLILSRKLLNRIKLHDGSLENHHIIPKSLGGDDSKDNLVLLTPKEHYIAHLLLIKLYEGKEKAKMCFALMMMFNSNHNQKRLFCSRRYEEAKLLVYENCGGDNHHNYGKKIWSDLEKMEISERVSGDKNPMYGKPPWNKGKKLKPHSEETKKKMSESHKGKVKTKSHKENLSKALKGKSKSMEHRQKLSDANKGKVKSKEHKEKLSKALTGKSQKVIKCPHCGTEGGVSSMRRWHFENCRLKF